MTNDIQSIAKRMREQSNRSTQYPLFLVQHEVQNYNNDGAEMERGDFGTGESMCDPCMDADSPPSECDDCPLETFLKFDWEWQFDMMAGVFFTEEACELHIKQNHYHYNKPRSYVIGSWRNPEMVAVMQHILGDDVPNYYK